MSEGLGRADGQCQGDRPVSCTPRTDRRTEMEGSTEEDYKEKLLWNVKREVGALWRHGALRLPVYV